MWYLQHEKEHMLTLFELLTYPAGDLHMRQPTNDVNHVPSSRLNLHSIPMSVCWVDKTKVQNNFDKLDQVWQGHTSSHELITFVAYFENSSNFIIGFHQPTQ